MAKATVHASRSPGSRRPTPTIVTPVSRKPAAVCSASADPAVPGGASSLMAVENWAESAITVMPQTTSTARMTAVGAPNRRPAAIALDPESAMAAIVRVVRPSLSARRAGRDAADGARRHHQERDAAGTGGIDLAGDGEAGGDEGRHPGPHRVELPHVAEVAEVGQLHAALAEGGACHAQAEPGGRRRQWTLPDAPPGDRGRGEAGHGGRHHDHPPVEAGNRPAGLKQVRHAPCRG